MVFFIKTHAPPPIELQDFPTPVDGHITMSSDLWLLICSLNYVQSNFEAYHFTVLRRSQICGPIRICGNATVDHQNQWLNTNIVKTLIAGI